MTVKIWHEGTSETGKAHRMTIKIWMIPLALISANGFSVLAAWDWQNAWVQEAMGIILANAILLTLVYTLCALAWSEDKMSIKETVSKSLLVGLCYLLVVFVICVGGVAFVESLRTSFEWNDRWSPSELFVGLWAIFALCMVDTITLAMCRHYSKR